MARVDSFTGRQALEKVKKEVSRLIYPRYFVSTHEEMASAL
jgi:hypothetical protein